VLWGLVRGLAGDCPMVTRAVTRAGGGAEIVSFAEGIYGLEIAVTSRRLVILVIGSSVGCDARQLVSLGVIEPILEGRVSELGRTT
jgi:hypothetical protein